MQAHDSDNDDNGDYFNPEEEVAIGDAKNCELPVNVVKSGEENEELIFKMRARLYRWRDNEWKERGTGEIKLLRDKTEKRIRFVLRQDKTLKAVANFIVVFSSFISICYRSRKSIIVKNTGTVNKTGIRDSRN